MAGDPYSKACLVAGCRQPVTSRGRCAAHGGPVDRLRSLGSDRLHKALYDSARWRRLRAWVLARFPLCCCAECQQTGRVVEATVVHHQHPHGGDASKFFDVDNLLAMAKDCHDQVTGRGRGGSISAASALGDRLSASRAF